MTDEGSDVGGIDDEMIDQVQRAHPDPIAVEDILDDLDNLVDASTSDAVREDVKETRAALIDVHERGILPSEMRALGARDAVEAFVGSVIFASPLLVEDGVFEIGQHLFTYTLGGIPIFLIANTAFVVLMTYALLEWTGRNTEETRTLFGVVPIRVLMVLGVSFLVATVLMTVWGRVDILNAPTEALARINVIWTVGSLGAALGDILSDSTSTPTVTVEQAHQSPGISDTGSVAVSQEETSAEAKTRLIAKLNERFDALEETVDPQDRLDVQLLREQTLEATIDDVVVDQIRKYTSRDIAEAFVGSVFFSIPFLVEDGVFDVATYFLSFQIGRFPVYFLVNAAFILVMVGLLVYWAGPKDVKVSRPLFGLIPRRLVGISLVSFLTAAALMTMWGRIDVWQDPVGTVARISVVWTVASFGASLGDILPGESSGDDINDELADFGDQVEQLLE